MGPVALCGGLLISIANPISMYASPSCSGVDYFDGFEPIEAMDVMLDASGRTSMSKQVGNRLKI